MFAENLIQKFLFSLSRKFNRQAVLVVAFTVLTLAAGFYDTLLWAVDSPGYVIKSKTVCAEVLAKQLVAAPSYITFISNPEYDLNKINIQDIFGANLYSPGLNFTLPGIVDAGTPQPIPPLRPLASDDVSPRIWLDHTGFAVGLDDAIMFTPEKDPTTAAKDAVIATQFPVTPLNVSTANSTTAARDASDAIIPLAPCKPSNIPTANSDAPVKTQVWNCFLYNTDALPIFERPLGQPQYWWGESTTSYNYLNPIRADNPWAGLRTGGDTTLMKQIFTIAKAQRRHTFLQTTFKATMISHAPAVFSNADVTDFINRLWGNLDQVTVVSTVQNLTDAVLQAWNTNSSLTVGSFIQQDDGTVESYSMEYLYIINPADSLPLYAAMRFASTLITLVDSEILAKEPVPLAACNGSSTNIGTGGVVRSMTCAPAELGSTAPPQFLGQLDTTSMVIINDILGDGTQGNSTIAVNQTGVDWYYSYVQDIEKLLTSRSFILDGRGSRVMVDVQTNEAAISYLQLLLVVFPIFLALGVWGVSFGKPMSYYRNSFLATVVATAHIDGIESEVGYMHHPPEVVLKANRGQLSLGKPNGELITVLGGKRADYDGGLVFEPLILPEKRTILSLSNEREG